MKSEKRLKLGFLINLVGAAIYITTIIFDMRELNWLKWTGAAISIVGVLVIRKNKQQDGHIEFYEFVKKNLALKIIWISLLVFFIASTLFKAFSMKWNTFSMVFIVFLAFTIFSALSYFKKIKQPVNYFLPYLFKKIGWVLLVCGYIIFILTIGNPIFKLPYQTKTIITQQLDAAGNILKEHTQILDSNSIVDLIAFGIFALGVLFIIISKEKTEDERTEKIRLLVLRDLLIACVLIAISAYITSYAISGIEINYRILLFCFPFLYYTRVKTLETIL
jgi:hypothetical protein